MSTTHEIKPSEIVQLARKHVFVGFCCLVACICLEFWFYTYPPRGVIAEDVIVTGSFVGSPLVDFKSLWARVLNDDELMLTIVERSKLCKRNDKVAQLNFLNSTIRQNLNFQFENETLVRVSFKRPGYSDVRPFLNYFTDKVIEKLNEMGSESFEVRKKKAQVQFSRALERVRFIAGFFKIETVKALLVDSTIPMPSDRLMAELSSGNIASSLGQVLLGELLPAYSTAQIHFEQYCRDDLKILELFPRSAVILTARDMPATPVQPFYQLIFILVPLATALVYVAVLLILGKKSQLSSNESC
ncbi:MAG: hypothetical protein ACD_39C02090G0005 [uncultured bacterium]|nr:MAG: hypothetical protein ACD_39C02090G0005 [uncultured bacterium]